ncbi:hypothetical protein RvY_01988 [Ramazzottius varieornatus]|uniref:Uncharacterized protein n=1 Tax=Ramazzottius varieornatus TaxID=947166 RepID=A0A1D1UI93_RAMVA|nr:hypothetical protein RvY_01988 [Ramazzottius varieornatus]
MAKQLGVRAAKLIGLNDCHSITAHGTSQALLYQCQKVTTDFSAKKTKCGMEPFVLNSSLSLDGYTLINPIVPCLHGGLFTTIGDQIIRMRWLENSANDNALENLTRPPPVTINNKSYGVPPTAPPNVAPMKPARKQINELNEEVTEIPMYRQYCILYHQDIATTNTWMTALYDIYAPIFHTEGQAQLFRTIPSIINYFCDGTVTNVVYPEAMPILMLARLPEALDQFNFSSTTFRQYRCHLDLDPSTNYTERYHHLLQYARPAHIIRRGQQLVKAMAINTYLLPCLII